MRLRACIDGAASAALLVGTPAALIGTFAFLIVNGLCASRASWPSWLYFGGLAAAFPAAIFIVLRGPRRS